MEEAGGEAAIGGESVVLNVDCNGLWKRHQ